MWTRCDLPAVFQTTEALATDPLIGKFDLSARFFTHCSDSANCADLAEQ
jgi:hypothetical protein